MYPSKLSDKVGIVIRDENQKLWAEIRQAQKEGKNVYLVIAGTKGKGKSSVITAPSST